MRLLLPTILLISTFCLAACGAAPQQQVSHFLQFPPFALVATNVLFELRDPFVGPAIRDEAGERYVWHFYASVAVGTALHLMAVAGAYVRSRARAA